jgi:hypothetical protein
LDKKVDEKSDRLFAVTSPFEESFVSGQFVVEFYPDPGCIQALPTRVGSAVKPAQTIDNHLLLTLDENPPRVHSATQGDSDGSDVFCRVVTD